MADYAPIIIKNGEFQQLATSDTLKVATLKVSDGGSSNDYAQLDYSNVDGTLFVRSYKTSVSNKYALVRTVSKNDLGNFLLSDFVYYGSTNAASGRANKAAFNIYESGGVSGGMLAGFVIGSNAFPTHMLDVYGQGWFNDTLNLQTAANNHPLRLYHVQSTDDTGAVIQFQGGSSGTTDIGYIGFTHRGSGSDTLFVPEIPDTMGIRYTNGLQFGKGPNARVYFGDGVNIGGTTDPGAGRLWITGSNADFKGQLTLIDPTAVGSSTSSIVAIAGYGSDNAAGSNTGRKWYFGTSWTGSDNDLAIFNTNNNAIVLGTNATERMRIMDGVNIGGSTDPGAGVITVSKTFRLKVYTVATLPAGIQGDIAAVNDAIAPAFLAIVVGGGTVYTPVTHNGANWIVF